MANDYSGIPILKTKKGFIWLELEIILADYMKQGISCPVTELSHVHLSQSSYLMLFFKSIFMCKHN